MKTIYLYLSFVFILISAPVVHSDTHQADNCTYSAVNTAIGASETGDIVAIPAGDCTWSVTNYVTVDKGITLQGAGIDATNITVSDTSFTRGALVVSGSGATVKALTFLQPDSDTGYIISVSGSNFRITGNKFSATEEHHHINTVYVNGAYGVIDNNTFEKQAGDSEFIFIQGPANSWQTANSIGGANNVFIENNTVTDGGYLDCHKNARCVFRYNTITGATKFDAHGKCSNTGFPIRGVRHWEIYNNLWTLTTSNTTCIEVRGGTGRIYNNVSLATNATYGMYLVDYSTFQTCPGVFDGCNCVDDYPIDDQIGVGVDPKVAASEPVYIWNNTRNNTSWIVGDMTWNIPGACEECGYEDFQAVIQSDRDYFVNDTYANSVADGMPAYTPYTCPHPLTGLTGSCDSAVAGTSGYNVALTSHFGGSFSGSLH